MMDLKYDILKHPAVDLTADGKGGVYQHGKVTSNVATIEVQYLDPDTMPDTEVSETTYELLSDEDFNSETNQQYNNKITEVTNMSIFKKNTEKHTEKLPMTGKVKKGFRIYCTAIMGAALISALRLRRLPPTTPLPLSTICLPLSSG